MSELTDAMVAQIKRENRIFYKIVEITDEKTDVLCLTPSNAAQDCYSVAKSVTSIAVGILQDKGMLSVNDCVYPILKKFFPEGYDKCWETVTIANVMHHRTGIERAIDFDLEDPADFAKPDMLHFLFSQPIVSEPGTVARYSDASFYIISRIVAAVTGKDLEDFLQNEVFLPLGFHVFAFSRCPLGYSLGGTGLFLRTEDMAKIGKLYLDRGVYNGKRIFSDKWADAVLSCATDEWGGKGFGLSANGGIKCCMGMFGQCIAISEKHRRVIAYHSYGGDDMSGLMNKFE